MWNERYSEPGFAFGTDPNDFLVESFHYFRPGGAVLCLAEGEGRNAVFLAEHGFQVTAVDNSEVGLDKAARLAAERGVEIVTEVADLAEYHIPTEKYDAIISIFCHLPPLIRQRLHKQIYSGLKTEGVFLLEAYTPQQLQYDTGGPKQKDMLMQLPQIQSELTPLKFMLAQEIEREIQEGVYHSGLGAVVQLIGYK